jgi:hypothetical protein
MRNARSVRRHGWRHVRQWRLAATWIDAATVGQLGGDLTTGRWRLRRTGSVRNDDIDKGRLRQRRVGPGSALTPASYRFFRFARSVRVFPASIVI